MFKSLLILAILCDSEQVVDAKLRVVKYVYQKDMSEHCRRRVMPSVFLGDNVVEANSQILHFSQLEVPYSCFVSIRTQSGGNIILVIQMDENLIGCSKYKSVESPVKVFSMGETFGGYWGPLPDSILATSTPSVEKFYTLKTTKKEMIADNQLVYEDDSSDDESSMTAEEGESKKTSPLPTGDTQDYIREMIPIINITGRLVKSDNEAARAFAADDTFDLFYNVQRKPGQKYESTVIPLMQFSVKEGLSDAKRSKGGDAGSSGNATAPEPRFDFEYDFGGFTLDPRLILPLSGTKSVVPGKRYRPYVNRRLNFKKNKGRLFSAQRSSTLSVQTSKTKKLNESWSYIESLLKNLTDNNLEQVEKESQSDTNRFSALLQRVADWQHNYSAYLAPNLTYTRNDPLFLGKMQEANPSSNHSNTPTLSHTTYREKESVNKTNIKKLSTKASNVLNKETTLTNPVLTTDSSTRLIKVSAGTRTRSPSPKLNDSFTKTRRVGDINNVIEVAMPPIQTIPNFSTGITKQIMNRSEVPGKTNAIKNSENSNFRSTEPLKHSTVQIQTQKSTPERPKIKSSLFTISPMTGRVADHASWENLVQVAPKMAGILNTTKAIKTLHTSSSKFSLQRRKRQGHRRRRRSRRSIHAIQIEPARPHNLTTDPDVITTPESMYNFVDMQDFAQLVELQDDEIQGHIALRYMRRYVGATMFDICTNAEHSTQHVLFFNTSRIVLALNNFTLKRMTVIATPARWLLFADQRCNKNSLECQVAGKRVCVNKLTACDGVPNCGARDIYDEDRLLCGEDIGLQHNVYLAAFTFLAVLLTMLYTVHYWLKRCVPKVSEAFFIYTDGTENILYLDSIMRSPLDNDNSLAMFHGINYLDDLEMENSHRSQKKKGIFKRMFAYCCGKKKLEDFEMVLNGDLRRSEHRFSFPELEIKKLTREPGVEVAVQTGDSLEIQSKSDSLRMQHQRDSVNPRAAFRDIRLNLTQDEESVRRSSEDSELNMLKFLRGAKNYAEQWNSSHRVPIQGGEGPDKEKELNCTIYDRSILSYTSGENSDLLSLESMRNVPQRPHNKPIIPFVQPHAMPGPSSLPPEAPRRIRFNDNLTTIDHEEIDNMEPTGAGVPSRDELQPNPIGSGRDFMRFWSSNKNKQVAKEKPKQRKQLPMH